jgi:ABC-2 type transport system permease protein
MIQNAEYSSWKCFTTLLKKEILRFLGVAGQTILSPLISASLYLLVFGVSLGQKLTIFENISYLQFIIPGLVLMGVINNSFANTSTSLFVSKYLGNIADLLVTPISSWQLISAYTIAAMLRGIAVGIITVLVSLMFTTLPWAHPWHSVIMILVASFLFAQFGLVAALYSKNFDTLAMFTNFLILPLVYLGGLFFPVKELPSPWAQITALNPLYYLIEGFRSSILGIEELPFLLCISVATVLSATMAIWASYLIRKGKSFRV